MEIVYINGQAVDLKDQAGVTLEFRSGLFSGLETFTQNISYSVTIPKTANNNLIFANIGNIGVVHEILKREFFRVDYERNGVVIVRDARGQLIEVQPTAYVISFAWGSIANIEGVQDVQLAELIPDDAVAPWGKTATQPAWVKYFNNLDMGIGALTTGEARRPCVSCQWLLEQLAPKVGFNAAQIPVQDLWMPLTSKNGNEASAIVEGLVDPAFYFSEANTHNYFRYVRFGPDIIQSRNIAEMVDFPHPQWNTFSARVIITIDLEYTEPNNRSEPFELYEYPITANSVALKSWNPTRLNNRWVIKINEIIDLSAYSAVTFAIRTLTNTSGQIYQTYKSVMTFAPLVSDLAYPSVFPIKENMPEMTQSVFLLNMLYLTGRFSGRGLDGKMMFYGADILEKNRNNPYDWSDRLIMPAKTTYAISDFAQQNWFRYAEDDLSPNADAFLPVDNRLIELSKDINVSEFGASYDDGTNVLIPIYSYEDSKLTHNDVSTPRIIKANGAKAEFRPLHWGEILKTPSYKYFGEIIYRPTVIEAQVMTLDHELAVFDLTRPPLIEQYGRMFHILNLKTGNPATAQMLQLPLIEGAPKPPPVIMHDIEYQAGAGNGYPHIETVEEGTYHTILSPADLGYTAPSGRVFQSWAYLAGSPIERRFNPGDSLLIDQWFLLVAQYEYEGGSTINVRSNDSTKGLIQINSRGYKSNDTLNIPPSGSVTLTSQIVSGYMFAGWYSGTTFLSGNATYVISGLTEGQILEIVGKFVIPATVTIQTVGFSMPGVRFSTSEAFAVELSREFPSERSVSMYAQPAPTQTDLIHTFQGWYDAPTGGALMSPNTGYTIPASNVLPNSNFAFYAQYTRATDIVTINVRSNDSTKGLIQINGLGYKNSDTIIAKTTNAIALAAQPTQGNIFTGWYKSGVLLSTATYYTLTGLVAGQIIEIEGRFATTVTVTVTLTADSHPAEGQGEVGFASDGIFASQVIKSLYPGETPRIIAKLSYSYAGGTYIFKGWYTARIGGTLISTESSYLMPALVAGVNVVYYAQYEYQFGEAE